MALHVTTGMVYQVRVLESRSDSDIVELVPRPSQLSLGWWKEDDFASLLQDGYRFSYEDSIQQNRFVRTPSQDRITFLDRKGCEYVLSIDANRNPKYILSPPVNENDIQELLRSEEGYYIEYNEFGELSLLSPVKFKS